jgi:hypothetical protein
MSARDTGPDGGDGFLGRWIRRKAEARDRPEEPVDRAVDGASDAKPKEQPASPAKADEPAFDLAKLPSLEEITAQTNVSDFMRREVPAALRNAALRRAWALDPAVRDYVNPAREYAYDWNVPGGVPGNGPLEAGYDALKQVAETLWSQPENDTLGVGKATGETTVVAEEPPKAELEATDSVRTSDIKKDEQNVDIKNENRIIEVADEGVSAPKANPVAAKRRHGGAAPV